MFSQVLGIGLSALGAFGANRQAQAAFDMEAARFDELRRQVGFNEYMASLAEDERKSNNSYIRDREQLDRLLAGEERQFQIDQLMRNQRILSEERVYDINRQMEMDREQARIREMQIQQLLQNQELSQRERAYAEQQLEHAKAIAAGEREDDLRRYYEERAIADQNRQFMMDQLFESQTSFADDRARDLADRDRVLGQVGGLQRALRLAELELGAVPDIPTISKEELDAEIARRQDQYQGDVDRAAERVASVNEANLIRWREAMKARPSYTA